MPWKEYSIDRAYQRATSRRKDPPHLPDGKNVHTETQLIEQSHQFFIRPRSENKNGEEVGNRPQPADGPLLRIESESSKSETTPLHTTLRRNELT